MVDTSTLGQPAKRLIIGIARREAERVAVRDQALGDREPDTSVRAGDERDAVGVPQLAHLPTLTRRDCSKLGLLEQRLGDRDHPTRGRRPQRR